MSDHLLFANLSLFIVVFHIVKVFHLVLHEHIAFEITHAGNTLGL